MKRILATIAIVTSAFAAVWAQSPEERAAWMKEMTRCRQDFIAHELSLSKDTQDKFFPLYDEMEAKIRAVNDQVREAEKSVYDKGDKATDLEREKASDAMFDLKARESAIEKEYYKKFKKVLSPTQLFKLKGAERHFNREMIKRHQQLRGDDGHPPMPKKK